MRRDGQETRARADDRPARRHRSAPPLGPAAAGARPHAGRFRGARQLPPAARLPAGAHARGARRIGPRRAAVLRPAQHPLHHQHGHRRMGARQADALRAADRQRRSVRLGFRLGGQASSAARAVAAARPLPRRPARLARRDRRRHRRCFAMRRAEIKSLLDAEGVGDMPLGLDVVEPPMLFELQKLGHRGARRPADACCRRAKSRTSTS